MSAPRRRAFAPAGAGAASSRARPLRIAFLGLPLAALLLRADGHDVVYAGVCRRDALGLRRLRAGLGSDRVVLVPNLATPQARARIVAAAPDLLVSWFWTKQVPASLLEASPLGALGVHPSLLPRHRGPDPYFWALLAGDAETGVTAHRLAEAYDTGEILGRKRLPIDPSWNAWTLAKRLDRPSLALLRETVLAFARGEPPESEAQDETRATSAPSPTDDQLEIRWRDQSAEEVVRLVRAASPWPGAFTEIVGTTVTVTQARVASAVPRALVAAEAAALATPYPHVVVRARDGAVELLAGRCDVAPAPSLRAAAERCDTEEIEISRPEDFVRLLRMDPVSS